jgi:protein-L-isoaspartate O-methyltransferase
LEIIWKFGDVLRILELKNSEYVPKFPNFVILFRLPYRIDVLSPPFDALDRLVNIGALDIEPATGGLAAILPDEVSPDAVAQTLAGSPVTVSPAVPRDDGSVWLLNCRPVRTRGGELRLTDSQAFGTGQHPSTVLCLEALEEAFVLEIPDAVLDVGTGTGVLALAALLMGVRRAVGVDIDADALKAAGQNARLNGLADRIELELGGPEIVAGTWPVVVANILAAPLIEMAPVLVRRLAPRGRLILSGIASTLESEVRRVYERLGMRYFRSGDRAGWSVLVLGASW